MQKLLGVFKLEFDTVRDLEHKGFRAFWITGGILAVGILLTMTAFFMFIGIPLIVVGAIGFLGSMLWIAAHSKEPTRRIFCPYCSTSNDVYQSRSEFSCDICERRIAVDPEGAGVALESD